MSKSRSHSRNGFLCSFLFFLFFPAGPESLVLKSFGTRGKKWPVGYMGHPYGDDQKLATATSYIHAILSCVNACSVLMLSLEPKKSSSRRLLYS